MRTINKPWQLLFVGMLLSLILFSLSVTAGVVTSIRPLGFIATAIADGVTSVDVLVPDGASPHTYALRPMDIQQIKQADLIVWIGPEMEFFLQKSLQQIKAEHQLTLVEWRSIEPLLSDISSNEPQTIEDGHSEVTHHHGQYDNHIWLSPAIAKEIARAIHAKLSVLYPAQTTLLDNNLYEFIQEVEQTEQNLVKMLAPVHGAGYFVFHDAYGYFERYFHLIQLGAFTINPEIQPGAKHLYKIKTDLVQQNAVCVFAEPQFRPAIIDTILQGTQVHKGVLDPLGNGIELSKDSYSQFLTKLSQQFISCLSNR